MLENRIYTFLELCTCMNYHKTAKNLNMTQPAVTQHIQHLEHRYHCKLFNYSNKKLKKTEFCLELERISRTMVALSLSAEDNLTHLKKKPFSIGATKTIGEYQLDSLIKRLFSLESYEVNLYIDNSESLFQRLNHFSLDILLLEGYVDKEKYLHEKMSKEELLGICSKEHKFAGKRVDWQEVFQENLFYREKGSGTRAVFQQFLSSHGYSFKSFSQKSMISSNKIIEKVVAENLGISFVYGAIPANNQDISTFRLKSGDIFHEFNYVYLDKSKLDIFKSIVEGIHF